MAEPARLLILGGTGEAVALAHRLRDKENLRVITALAGRTRRPAAVPGEVRRGGFGGASGLARYLEEQSIGLVIDATHPFAATISRNAADACAAAGAARLLLARPPWHPRVDDRWINVPDGAAAAAVLPELGRRIFLSIGRQSLGCFAGCANLWFLVRMIDQPDGPLPLDNAEVILGRGPFPVEDELMLLKDYGIAVLVTRNSGGLATFGKVEAARRLGLPVVMIDRPAVPQGACARGVDDAVAWVEEILAPR